ncbi:MAG TPA: methyltransferase domain-containing protein [Spirochaetota bacterium]|nr:MAG: Methyltransferase domain protein [Spirochaetes bacterium ADurb.Bin133]HNZ27375.1 methyltransferase domain-containing protein [Spirochaetota bacterium]HOF00821.1 methyltransferase domain-containing protein [Spirochaetota bacterium]HOS32546.1 methyltransferase domain-containing protein [Spirochaetota bacterium]HOS55996.1 methyltransferase domain-containing protein [Spirochaetota bacterium]
MKKYVNYGCGLTAPKEWINFDSSPTLRIQRIPVLGFLLKKRLNAIFPKNVKYGDIVKGLPLDNDSCDGIFCSHVLEHLSYEDFLTALKNTYKILKPGGIFRLVMPDLSVLINSYIDNKKNRASDSSVKFIKSLGMGLEKRDRGIKSIFVSALGNAKHLWLWDKESAICQLEKTGFTNIRVCEYNDSEDDMFKLVEEKKRFENSIALEMKK